MEKRLSDLLSKLPIPGLKDSNDRHTIAEVITSILGVPVTPKQLTLKEGRLSLSLPPIVKSAAYLHVKKLTEALRVQGIVIVSLR
jgi:hypothetical protein